MSYLRVQETNTSNIFNVGYGRGVSVKEAISAVEIVSAKKANITVLPRRSGDCACVIADNSKILSLTDWKPKYQDIKTIAKYTYMWEQIRER